MSIGKMCFSLPICHGRFLAANYCQLCSKVFGLMGVSTRNYRSVVPVSIPVLKVPKRLEKKIDLIRKSRQQDNGRFRWQGRVFNSRPGKELISAKRKEYNHYQNQIYDKSTPIKIASHGWKHRKSIGDHFTILAFRGNPSIQDEEIQRADRNNFDRYNLDNRLLAGLHIMDINNPTVIQDSAIPVLMKGRNVLFAAETGSGKTLAYLLPILNAILISLSNHGRSEVTPGSPKGLIIVPAQELAQQVHQITEFLSNKCDLISKCLDGGKSVHYYRDMLKMPVDILVATPGTLMTCVRKGSLSLNSVHHTVIDEVDTMLDDSFKSGTIHILKKIQISSIPVLPERGGTGSQLILAGATMPRQAINALEEVISEHCLDVISTPHLHRIQPHIIQKFLRLHSRDKTVTLLETVSVDVRKKTPIIIFCNDTSTCDWLSYTLEENGMQCLRLNGGMTTKMRAGIMSSFQSGSCNILVCTDIASRGLDTNRVQHIINFDFPNCMSDYIHRVGRVGRVSSKTGGHVTNFVVHKWDVELVNKIETAVRTRDSLPTVDANIKRKFRLRSEEDSFTQMLAQ